MTSRASGSTRRPQYGQTVYVYSESPTRSSVARLGRRPQRARTSVTEQLSRSRSSWTAQENCQAGPQRDAGHRELLTSMARLSNDLWLAPKNSTNTSRRYAPHGPPGGSAVGNRFFRRLECRRVQMARSLEVHPSMHTSQAEPSITRGVRAQVGLTAFGSGLEA